MDILERIAAKLDTTGGPDACHPWTGVKVRAYGSISWRNKSRYVHRLLFCLANDLPYDFDGVVRHVVCHNPICGNVRHLASGTQADNLADMVRDGNSTRGERHPMVKLTREQVLEIRAREGDRPKDLAREFAVCHEQIRRIQKRKTWAWL
jgi:hypothetical protein